MWQMLICPYCVKISPNGGCVLASQVKIGFLQALFKLHLGKDISYGNESTGSKGA